MTRADKLILKRAVDFARNAWEQYERNFGVMARARPGAWHTDPTTAARKRATIQRRLERLNAAAKRLDLT
jgi:hypothetical protein